MKAENLNLKKQRILQNTLISVGMLFGLVRLLAAGTHDGSLDLGDTPLGGGIITFDAPGAGTGPIQGLSLWPSIRWGRSRVTTLTRIL